MEEEFKAAEFLFKKIKKLYPTFVYPDELDFEAWTENLEGYSQVEILDALKEYRKNVEYNKAPNPAEFKKFLTMTGSKTVRKTEDYSGYFSIESKMMKRDLGLKRCSNTLTVYRKAVERILNYNLPAKVGIDEVKKAVASAKNDCEVRGIKYSLAMRNGLFNDFDRILVEVGGKSPLEHIDTGSVKVNMSKVNKLLGAHFSCNDDSLNFDNAYGA